MKTKPIRQPKIHVAIAEDDSLRLIGFRALLESEQDLELQTVSLTETLTDFQADVVLVDGTRRSQLG
jgi:DNA-binding NarL/FixJ family response regulator